ncbi:SIMPL domain-containing protein [Candidatus Peribacteria bacterium]|nr:SIMPL domain-containing protein [Candidatus Peribacteria bacterium]
MSVPDIASFSFEVITEGDTDVASLQSKNAEKMNAAIAFVGKAGIDKKDIKTQQYSISPRYQTTSCTYRSGDICPPASISGYTVKQSVFVKIRDFKLISTLLSGVVENGANSVGQIQFSLDNTDELENTARAEAIKKAQEKAEKVAQAGGFKLGRLLEISE